MKNNFNFLAFTESISGIISLPLEKKEKKNPFIIVNTDNDRGLYVKKLEKELAKYKNIQLGGTADLYDIETSNLIVFGDSHKFDYRIEMNYVKINSLVGKNFKVYDMVDDFDKIVRRLATYCKSNGIKRKRAYDEELVICPLHATTKLRGELLVLATEEKPVKKTLVNVYKTKKPDVTVEKVTVHDSWVKIGWNQYDIWFDLDGREFITLEDGERLYVESDRLGRRFLVTE